MYQPRKWVQFWPIAQICSRYLFSTLFTPSPVSLSRMKHNSRTSLNSLPWIGSRNHYHRYLPRSPLPFAILLLSNPPPEAPKVPAVTDDSAPAFLKTLSVANEHGPKTYAGKEKLVISFDIGTSMSTISFCHLCPGEVPTVKVTDIGHRGVRCNQTSSFCANETGLTLGTICALLC